jgi:arginyl-tRNA synthetase
LAAMSILGEDSSKIRIGFINMVLIIEDNQKVKMSKRAGTSLTINEVLEQVPADILRFYLLSKNKEQNVEIDINKTLERDSSNPYYYIQYSNVRANSILRKYFQNNDSVQLTELPLIGYDKYELALIKEMIKFNDILLVSQANDEPAVILQYMKSLANSFHSFYNNVVVINNDKDLAEQRIVLVEEYVKLLNKLFKIIGVKPKLEM